MAEGGTFFLDEVGDLPTSLQVKLLRFLQERKIERLGGRKEIAVDVRVICATHRALPKLIADGRFREDMYYRISEVNINIPPLRDRHGDAALLAAHFLERFNHSLNMSIKGFSAPALEAIAHHDWPGNIRELENRIKRAMVMTEDTRIGIADLELDANKPSRPLNLREVRERAERDTLVHALSLYQGNLSKIADALGISRPTLYNLLNKHDLK
jgi:two-component system NtrC family response regulator